MTGRRALVTGITGQDGSYLAELLLTKGYCVHATWRGEGVSAPLIPALAGRVELHEADLLDAEALRAAVSTVAPHELFHLAAPTFVPASWEVPAQTIAAIAGATGVLLEAARTTDPAMRVYVAASSEVFGDCGVSPQAEDAPMRPRSPYGAAKLAAHALAGAMRARYGLHVSSGILFNHESPRRPERFLPRKVTRAAASIKLGLSGELALGDLSAVRDWCHAADAVHAAWLMVQQDDPGDYVVASGVGRTVGDLVRAAFAHAGLDAGEFVRVDEQLVRPPEATPPVGDPRKARAVLGWEPAIPFDAMIGEMVDADVALLGGASR